MPTKNTIIKVLNCFETGAAETDYFSLFLYKDGPNKTKQTTLGRGYTENGSLWNVFEHYKENGGKYGEKLLSYKDQKGKETLPYNKEFLNLIVKAAKEEQAMRVAEDQVFDEIYWNKGLNYFNAGGFKENLSLCCIEDSILHSGGMLSFLVNSFPEKKPISGGNERLWIESYCKERKDWLYGKGGLLRNTVYRMDFMLDQIKHNNWALDHFPIYPNDTKIAA